MKKTLLAAALLLETLAAASPAAASTADYPAVAVCRSVDNSNVLYNSYQVWAQSTTTHVQFICPLKQVACSGNCTYYATVFSVDNNSSTGIDNDISCRLVHKARATAYLNYTGSSVTQSNTNSPTTFTMSVNVTTAQEGWLIAECTVGKDPSGNGSSRSYLVEFYDVHD